MSGIFKVDPGRAINRLAGFLSTATGFIATFLTLLVGIAIGALLQFNEGFMFGFNIFLSVAAIVISGVILVSGARSEAALQVKLDYLIEASKAPNASVGLEHKDVSEIEAERVKVESAAAEELDEAIEKEVAEQVTEQLDERASRTATAHVRGHGTAIEAPRL
jgi:low affinity Fe/Cu permease